MNNSLRHLGIIPDGNRRWASQNQLSNFDAYLRSFNNIIDIIEYSFKTYSELTEISIYLLSFDNLNRSKKEIDDFLSIGIMFLNLYL